MGSSSLRDGTWYSKHVQKEGSDVPMYFDRLVSDDYAVSKKKIGSGMQGSVYGGTSRTDPMVRVAIKETHS